MFFLSAHYSSPIDYTDEKIKEARESLDRIARFLEKAGVANKKYKSIKEVEQIRAKFIEAMDDDLNISIALSHIFEFVKEINTLIMKNKNTVCDYQFKNDSEQSKTIRIYPFSKNLW